MFEEVEDAKPKLEAIENEISKVKSESNELTAVIQEMKEEAMLRTKEFRKWKVCFSMFFLWLCFITIVVVYITVGKSIEKKFLVEY